MGNAFGDDKWLEGNRATLQSLDKITARIAMLKENVGGVFNYGSLEVTIHACYYRPPTLAPEHAALMEIKTRKNKKTLQQDVLFKGWMFASSPALNALEHAVYDLTLIECSSE